MTTGSLINTLMGAPADTTPKVGMGATILMWTDRHAATVIEVITPKKIVVQEDTATRTDNYGMSDAQSYDYTPNPNGVKRTFTLRKNGAWVMTGMAMQGGTRLRLGVRDEYYDYSC